MRYLSLFSGIGGFELGIQQAYESLHNRPNIRNGTEGIRKDMPDAQEQSNGLVCIGFSEIDKYATAIYQKHYPTHKNYGDITKIDTNDLPDFDLLVGGFPCQAFSIAGKRGGFDDTRGTLFFEIARIAREKQPRLLLLENVKGLLSHDEGRTFRTIIATLDELGYDLQWQIINSKDHGVAQNRERIFIIGHLRGTPRPEVFPLGEDGSQHNEVVGQQAEVTGTINSSMAKGGNKQDANARVLIQHHIAAERGRYNEDGSTSQRLEARKDGLSNTLTSVEKDNRVVSVKVPEATKKGYAEATVGQSINLAVPNSKTRRGRVPDIAQTLDTGMQQHTLTNEARIRRLTPTECERLQGFPDGWTAKGVNEQGEEVEISDTQRYKTLGNAVTVNVIKDIMMKLL